MVEFNEALKVTFPMLCAFIPLGLGFGYLSQQLGLPWQMVTVMAISIYAGSAEFIVATMLAKLSPAYDIILAASLCNLRHIFYGISVQQYFPSTGFKRFYMIHALTDETYAILSSYKNQKGNFPFYVSILNHIYWVISVLIGISLGKLGTLKIDGLEFVLTALFIVLTIEQIYHVKKWSPFICSSIASIISMVFFASNQMLLISIIITSVLLFISGNYVLKTIEN